MAVRGQSYVALQGVRPVLDRFPVRGQGVLGRVLGGSPVGDDLDGVLWCVGHRVMVPPSPGTRGGADASAQQTGTYSLFIYVTFALIVIKDPI